MQPQLYMWEGARRIFLEQHRFYVEQVKTRLLSQFDDLEGQADRFAEETFERFGSAPGHGDVDMADLADAAYEEAASHYLALVELRKQVLLSGLAGMYHQWDKQLREFIERELHHYVDAEWTDKNVWKPSGDKVLDILEAFGWPVKSLPIYALLDALQLVVNVYKHGKGRSLNDLDRKYSHYVVDPVKAAGYGAWRTTLDHEWLTVTDEQFDEFANAVSQFWSQMPERLYYEVPK
ncbi:hypothetical protein CA223_04420 [Sphingomonas koreensis]|jgi:hypothetical protein|uniref:Uncharacterized protein n=1 Tax=Sphingomonas koreensis TaxID=93064 RepID=A0A1L6JB50_9SPHN|nr:hypothetical protein [Sphingomonas koreensis]APR53179.1 hypothetical protein BRX40_12765 [Sphingomonas koreensis]RSU24694.1 hypothetical protein CA224_03060 [Sphingomonas koreensis]RSU25000.1 hypothetical protein CA225_16970 [Sphingomonas koreensis]RSU27036.1 hypothetical protein CA222_08390 [Sphingomonas koreensis]RSU32871.1 hypothetical protein BRX39_14220 [Sphingomonas koreensis]